jgi:hypothetical protein
MANKKSTVLPIILMVDDRSTEGVDQFVLALKKSGKEDIPQKAQGKVIFEAGLLIDPVDYLPGFRRRKGEPITTDMLADEVKGLRDQLKKYETYLRKQKKKKVDVHTLLSYLYKRS